MSQLKKYFSTIQNCEQTVLENQKTRHRQESILQLFKKIIKTK